MNEIKNILVTGASGKIGRNLLPVLLADGYNVRAVQYKTPVECEGVEVVPGSITDEKFVGNILEDIDAVCHLATCKEDRDNFLKVSVNGTFNLLDVCKSKANIKQFILAGGDASLGIFFNPNPLPLSEKSPMRAYPGYYAFSKVIEETMVNQYYLQYDLPCAILRFSWIHDEDDILAYMTLKEPGFGGPDWREIAITAEQKNYIESGRDGVGCLLHPDGKPFVRHIVGIGDVMQAFRLALVNHNKTAGETFNIAAPTAFSYDVLSEYISQKLDLPIVKFELDGFHDFSIDINKARTILGYQPQYDVFKIVDDAIDFRNTGRNRSEAKYTG